MKQGLRCTGVLTLLLGCAGVLCAQAVRAVEWPETPGSSQAQGERTAQSAQTAQAEGKPRAQAASAPAQRPARWAQALTLPGVDNLYKVDKHLYRGAQPTAIGLHHLEELGVRTLINLRDFASDTRTLSGTRLTMLQMDVNTWKAQEEDVARVLKLLRNRARAPFLVHCQHGTDRTGMVMAAYRMVEQGWSREQAIDEMTEGGFGSHKTMRQVVRFIERLDVRKMRAALAE
jgi:protein tyrosine phosphatase (PTP) superfamily phosphohydrolase (DUF442 family)